MLANKNTLSWMPENACNSHLHIIDPTYPNNGKAQEQKGTIAMYKKVAAQIHMPRAVFVQAKPFELDNKCLLDAIHSFGIENSRGIAVTDSTVTDQELQDWHHQGIRGLRFSIWNPANAVVSIKDCLGLAHRIKNYDWNIQLHMSAAQLLEYKDIILNIPCKIVIDHMGRLNPSLGLSDPAYPFICRLIDKGNTWVKLCGPYLNTKEEYPWRDAQAIAQAFSSYAPERMLFGTDWPHVTEKEPLDEIYLANLACKFFKDEKALHLALVENPCRVYGFKNNG